MEAFRTPSFGEYVGYHHDYCLYHMSNTYFCFQVNLMDCPRITGTGVQWLAAGCPALSSLNLKGTKATLTAINIIKERYPNSRINVRMG